MLHCDQGRKNSATRLPDEMDRAGAEPANERRKISGMKGGRVPSTVVGPRRHAVIAVSVSNEAVTFGDLRALRLPEPKIRNCTMHENDGGACALLDVGQVNIVHTQLTHLRRSICPGLEGEATDEHNGNRQPDGFEPDHDDLPFADFRSECRTLGCVATTCSAIPITSVSRAASRRPHWRCRGCSSRSS